VDCIWTRSNWSCHRSDRRTRDPPAVTNLIRSTTMGNLKRNPEDSAVLGLVIIFMVLAGFFACPIAWDLITSFHTDETTITLANPETETEVKVSVWYTLGTCHLEVTYPDLHYGTSNLCLDRPCTYSHSDQTWKSQGNMFKYTCQEDGSETITPVSPWKLK